MNRALLKKLRPGPLGRVKLAELLDELIVGFQRRHPGHAGARPRSASLPIPTARQSTSRSIAAFRKASPTPSATATPSTSLSISPRNRPHAGSASGRARSSPYASAMTARASRPTRQGLRPDHHDRARALARRVLHDRERTAQGNHASHRDSGAAGKRQKTKNPRARWRDVMSRVLVIDDHPIVLQGCRQLLEDAGVEQIIQAQSSSRRLSPLSHPEAGRDHCRSRDADRRARRAVLHPPASLARYARPRSWFSRCIRTR